MFDIICNIREYRTPNATRIKYAFTQEHYVSPKKPLMMKHTYVEYMLIDLNFAFISVVIFNSRIVMIRTFIRGFIESSLH